VKETVRNPTPRRVTGDHFEDAARLFLQARGMRLVRANFLCRLGEIDLVMRDGEVLVFVEVRYRKSRAFGGALGSITAAKRQRIIRAAQVWLRANPWDANRPCRFDVIAFEGEHPEWIKNAFEH
jgi:putative endonuclease